MTPEQITTNNNLLVQRAVTNNARHAAKAKLESAERALLNVAVRHHAETSNATVALLSQATENYIEASEAYTKASDNYAIACRVQEQFMRDCK